MDKDRTVEQEVRAFSCFCCGICCSGYQVQMSVSEAQRIADQLGVAWVDFCQEYLDPRWPGKETLVLRAVHGRCIFLNQETGSVIGLCKIHAFKPTSCIEWKASPDRKECRQGLTYHWGLSIGENGELQGSSEARDCFYTFLKSLTREE